MASEDSNPNFRVYVRCRNTDGAGGRGPSPYEAVSSKEIVRKINPRKQYRFDHVFDQSCDQQNIYKECADPLIDEFLRGYNGTLFAYGQTGTGKTYTITGDCVLPSVSEKAGIIPRVLEAVFGRLESSNSQDWILELKYIELYNEELRDLLNVQSSLPHSKSRSSTNSSVSNKQLRIVENRNSKSIEVVGAVSIPVSNLESALSVIRDATCRRQTAATQLNADSSRSHAILTLILVSREPVSGMAVRSKLHLVDLAGSENIARSGAVRLRAQEAGEINKSLLSLGRVIEMLVSFEQQSSSTAKPGSTSHAGPHAASRRSSSGSHNNNSGSKPYVSYRESKLTHLLQDSLGGSTKTCMIATVSLSTTNAEESRSTLEYASRARSIRNQTQTEVEVMEMQGTLKGLAKRLEEVHQELTMQRSRDGGVYVASYNFQQLKSNQRKYAELLAQRETAAKHHALEIDDLRQSNSSLKAERDALQAELDSVKERNLQYRQISESNGQYKEAVTSITDSFSLYTGKVDMFAESVYAKIEKLPLELGKTRKQLQQLLDSNTATKDIKDEAGSTITSASGVQATLVKKRLEDIIVYMDQTLRNVVGSIFRDLNESWNEISRDMSASRTRCAQLQRQLDSMQADMAMQQQAGAEMLRLSTMLKANDQRFLETMNQLTKERHGLINDLIAKQDPSTISKLSSDASIAVDLVKEIEKGVTASPPYALSVDKLVEKGYPANLGNEATEQMRSSVDHGFLQLNHDACTAVSNAVDSVERTRGSLNQELRDVTKNLDHTANALQAQDDHAVLRALQDKRTTLLEELSKIQRLVEVSEENSARLTSSPTRSQLTGPIRSLARSPVRSPVRSFARSPIRSPTRSPTRNPTHSRSPTRPVSARSPLKALHDFNNTADLRASKTNTVKDSHNHTLKATRETSAKQGSRALQLKGVRLPPPKRMKTSRQP